MKKTEESKNDKKTLVLLDAHAIIHRAYHALPDFASPSGEPTGALYGLSSMLLKIVSELNPSYLVACFDLPDPTHRHTAYDGYKSGRQKVDDALVTQLKRAKDVMKAFGVDCYEKAGFEADDLLGTIVELVKDKKNIEVIIASGDMDTLQLVDGKKVRVYTLKRGLNDTVLYDEKAVSTRYSFGPKLLPDYKGLAGDQSDNIIGVKGIGEKTATNLIVKYGSIESIYKEIKKNRDNLLKEGVKERAIKLLEENKEEAEFSKMLATIRRDAPIDFKIPEKTYKESVSMEEIDKLFRELSFKTLGSRARQVLTGQSQTPASAEADKPKAAKNTSSSNGTLFGDDPIDVDSKNDSNDSKKGPKPEINSSNRKSGLVEHSKESELVESLGLEQEEFEKLKIAVWLLDSGLTNPTPEDILFVGKSEDTKKAAENIYKQIEEKELSKVFYEIELPLREVIKKMEDRGILLDKKVFTDLHKICQADLEGYQKEIYKLAGQEFNINSPKQLGVVLFEKMELKAKGQKKTAGGVLSTRESEMEKLKDLHPIIEVILNYREMQKLLSTYIDVLPDQTDKTGRLHAKFLQTGSTTGRMSSAQPNLQNIPIKNARGNLIRTGFIAEKGFELVSIDYSQIELRVLAMLSKDPKLIATFTSGGDIHKTTAAEIFGVKPNEVDAEMRRVAKVVNFGILYGMGVNALDKLIGAGRQKAVIFYNRYFEQFPTIAKFISDTKKYALQNGYTKTYFGRRRYFDDIKSKLPYIRAAAERTAVNAPIQGTSADIIKLAMSRIDRLIEERGWNAKAYLLLQVHDELVFEVKKDLVAEAVSAFKHVMEESILPKDAEGITFTADVKIGNNWGEMKPYNI